MPPRCNFHRTTWQNWPGRKHSASRSTQPASAVEIDPFAYELHAFIAQHFLFFRQPAGITGELAGRTDHPMARHARGVRVFVHRVSHGAISGRPDGGSKIGVGGDLALRDSAAHRPDFLVETHGAGHLAGEYGRFSGCISALTLPVSGGYTCHDMKIALAQMECKLGDVPGNVSAMVEQIRAAKTQEADVIVFPETCDTGYDMPTILRTASTAEGEPRVRLAQAARESSMWVVAGLSLREGDRVFNTAVAFDRAGNLAAEYRKIHLFTGEPACEHKSLAAGESQCVFDLEGVPTGLMICYDLRFPELARALMLAGAELLIIPAAWPQVRAAHWDALLVARAIENQLQVIGVNRAGRDGELTHAGRSTAIDSLGKHLHLTPDNHSQTVVVNCDIASVRDVRRRLKFLPDRRPELYRI